MARTRKELQEVAAEAEQKFWLSVAEQLPEIKTGDLSIQNTVGFSIDCEAMVMIWFRTNGGEVE